MSIYNEKKKVADDLFGGRCEGCRRSYGSGFAFHHLKYYDDEKTYCDFTSSKEYNKYLLPIVRKRPHDFSLLCRKCHFLISNWGKYAPPKFDRLAKIVQNSR